MTLLLNLLAILGLGGLHEAGFRGEGTTIAIIDAGFFRANDPSVFPQDHIIGVYDMLEGDSLSRDTFDIFSDPENTHGTMCLSTMLYADENFTGTAPDANYILIRSEDIYAEYYGEEERLARALRMADSLDVDVVSISLGYNLFDDTTTSHVYADMDGHGVAAQVATELMRKGRMVCIAAGNDGNKAWHYLSTPGDAYDILTVGACDEQGTVAGFSSYGPSYDGRIKPEVAAWGLQTVIYNPSIQDSIGNYIGGITKGNGTSFATPEIAGMTACLRQAFPTLSTMELRQAILESCSQFSNADCRLGYGIPDAWSVYQTLQGTGIESLWNKDEGKVLENGRIYIIRNGIRYDVLGRKQ